MPYTETQLTDIVRRAVQAELGDENVGAFSDRVAEKVRAATPSSPAAGGAVDVDALADAVADVLSARLAE